MNNPYSSVKERAIRMAEALFGGALSSSRSDRNLDDVKTVAAVWLTPDGQYVAGNLPASLKSNNPIRVHSESLLHELGFNPLRVNLNLNGSLTTRGIQRLLPEACEIRRPSRDGGTYLAGYSIDGESVAFNATKRDGQKVWSRWHVKWDGLPAHVQARLIREALGAVAANKYITGVETQDLIPCHGNWLYDTGRLGGMDNQVVQVRLLVPASGQLGWRSFCRENGISAVGEILQRAGKDICNAPISPRIRCRILVLPDNGKNDDGNFYMLADHVGKAHGSIALTRGLCHYESSPRILKGRVLYVREFPALDGYTIPQGVDGVSRAGNFKWGDTVSTTDQPVIVDVDYWEVEEEHERDVNASYKMHFAFSYITEWEVAPGSPSLHRLFTGHMRKVDRSLGDPSSSIMSRLFHDESRSLIADHVAARLALGVALDDDLAEYQRRILQRIRAVRSRNTAWAAVVFTESWFGVELNPDQILISEPLRAKLDTLSPGVRSFMKGRVGVCRWPLTSRQSLCTVNVMDGDNGMSGEFVVAHPALAEYLQGDGDDHLLLMLDRLPKFSPASGEQSLVRPPEGGHPKDPNTLSLSLAYIKGEWFRRQTGRFANLLMRGYAASTTRELSDMVARIVGSAVDICVQGAKKHILPPSYADIDILVGGLFGHSRFSEIDPTTSGAFSTDKSLSVDEASHLSTELFGVELSGSIATGTGNPGIRFNLTPDERAHIVSLLKAEGHAIPWQKGAVVSIGKFAGLSGDSVGEQAAALGQLFETDDVRALEITVQMVHLYSALFWAVRKDGIRLRHMSASVPFLYEALSRHADAVTVEE